MTNERMDLTLSVDEQRTQELLRIRKATKKQVPSDDQYENLFRKQGITILK